MKKTIFSTAFALLGFLYSHAQSTTGYINNHEYVDLGLSVKWAICNVGAESPEDYGDYFAWGEINPKSEYTIKNSVTYGKEIEGISGDPQFDAATANWGGTWRIPTAEEIDELLQCDWKWTRHGDYKGFIVTGPNGNSIFLPAAGWRLTGSSLQRLGKSGLCWSATPYENNLERAYSLDFINPGIKGRAEPKGRYWYNRNFGQSIRPVSE